MGRFCGNFLGHFFLFDEQMIHRCFQCLCYHRSLLGREASLENPRAIVVLEPAQFALCVAQVFQLQCVAPFDVAVHANLPFNVAGGAAERYMEQHVLIGGGCHAGHGPHFGITHPALPKRSADFGQAGQSAGNPDLFAGRADIQATAPVQPVGTRLQGCRR